MGREDVAVCHWQGDVAEVKLHLDSSELTLRGDIRAAIARRDMQEVVLVNEGVQIQTSDGLLFLELATKEAERWQKALLKTPPTLAEKLGVSPQNPAYVLGAFDDAALSAALLWAEVSAPKDAEILLALIFDQADLDAAAEMALSHPTKHVWMVHRKGKAAVIGDTVIRAHMRGLGFIDSKTSAISDQLTTTRYRLRAK